MCSHCKRNLIVALVSLLLCLTLGIMYTLKPTYSLKDIYEETTRLHKLVPFATETDCHAAALGVVWKGMPIHLLIAHRGPEFTTTTTSTRHDFDVRKFCWYGRYRFILPSIPRQDPECVIDATGDGFIDRYY